MLLFLILIKKSYPQVYLEECKYKIKKTQIAKFIKTELKSDSDLEVESKSDAKLMAKLKSNSDNDSGYDTVHWFFYLHGWL